MSGREKTKIVSAIVFGVGHFCGLGLWGGLIAGIMAYAVFCLAEWVYKKYKDRH